MDSSKHRTLAKALKQLKSAKGGGDSLALDVPPPTPPAPIVSLPSPPSSPQTYQTHTSPSPIDADPLDAASTCVPAPPDKGKRVLEITSDSEDSEVGLVFKKIKATRVPTLPTASPGGGVDSLRDNPPSAMSPPPQTVQEERDEGGESAPPPLPLSEAAAASGSAPPALLLFLPSPRF